MYQTDLHSVVPSFIVFTFSLPSTHSLPQILSSGVIRKPENGKSATYAAIGKVLQASIFRHRPSKHLFKLTSLERKHFLLFVIQIGTHYRILNGGIKMKC